MAGTLAEPVRLADVEAEGRPLGDVDRETEAVPQNEVDCEAELLPLSEALGETEEDRDGREALGGGEKLPETLALPEAKGDADVEAQGEGRGELLAQSEALGASVSMGVPEPLATPLCEDHAVALREALDDVDGD